MVCLGSAGNKSIPNSMSSQFAPAMFQFEYVKDESGPGGFKMKINTNFSDPTQVIVEMIKRGMLKPGQLLGQERDGAWRRHVAFDRKG